MHVEADSAAEGQCGGRTQQQGGDTTQVGPGNVAGRAEVLHVCEVEDDGHKADEDEVGSAHNAEEERRLAELGAAQDQLEEDLFEDRGEEKVLCEVTGERAD